MIFENDKISMRQLQALLILDILGACITNIPKKAVAYAVQDGWISTLVSLLLACASVYLITTSGKILAGRQFTEYAGIILGKPLGALLAAGLFVKIAVCTGMQLRLFGEIVRQIMLPNTPIGVVTALIAISGLAAAAAGYEARARAGEILVFVVTVPMLILLAFVAFTADFTNLLPLFKSHPADIARGGAANMAAFTGIEFLYLVFPFIRSGGWKEVRPAAIKAVTAAGALALIITVVTIAKFSPAVLATEKWPLIQLMDSAGTPGSFLERMDAVLMSFWIVSAYAMVSAGVFFSALLTKSVIKAGGYRGHAVFCALLVFAVSFAAANEDTANAVLNFMFAYFGGFYYFIIPVLLICVAKIRRLGAK